jgi:hypothetical protein
MADEQNWLDNFVTAWRKATLNGVSGAQRLETRRLLKE